MSEARMQTEWDRTASIMTIIHNANCTKSNDRISDPAVFNPLRKQSKRGHLSIAEARQMVTGRKTKYG